MPCKTTSGNAKLSFFATTLFSVSVLMLITRSLFAQVVPSPTSSPTTLPTASATQSQEQDRSAALQQYREVLEKERKILEDQSREYYTRVEKFAYLSLGALVTALIGLIGFFAWMFGQTRREVVSQIKSDLQNSAAQAKDDLEQFKREKVESLNAEYQRLKEQFERIGSFAKRQVIWLLKEDMPRPEGEIAALHSLGLTHVATSAPKVDSPEEIKEALKDADLAIITFDGSPEAKTLLRHASTALKFRQPPISLLIYTYDCYLNDKSVQLEHDDLKLLKDLSSFAPANFPATLISQAQSLIIKSRAVV